MADEERTEEDKSAPDEPEEVGEDPSADGDKADSDGGSEPGDWERKPSEPDSRRHDDGSEALAEPSDDDDDDAAEQQSGDITTGDDEGFSRPDAPDEASIGESGQRLQDQAEPLLGGRGVKTPAGPVPTLSLVGMAAFVVVFWRRKVGVHRGRVTVDGTRDDSELVKTVIYALIAWWVVALLPAILVADHVWATPIQLACLAGLFLMPWAYSKILEWANEVSDPPLSDPPVYD